ncbi:hypothetical protein BB560_006669 [Smittium megazygosporum]|uniref:Uncharacterized protein n=1 Tax=Smittium megazygosporum TaxID=133381 RepID=A0A2T9Y2H6_9FUNG|nr:hypothetical protein BB560_006669 [Smittium megazygosporum]
MFERIKDQTVFITGASSGIGKSTAIVFAEFGANVVIAARRGEKLAELEGIINQKCPTVKVHKVVMDVSNEESIKAGFESLPSWAADIDVLVNNAGVSPGVEQIKDLTSENMDTMLNTNIKSLVFVTQQVLPRMLQRDSGTVINIGSVLGSAPRPTAGMYSATKFALSAITQTLRMETNDTNVRIVEVKPGIVQTEFNVVRNFGDQEASDKFYEAMPSIPPEDVAEAILFAASRDPRCVITEISVVPKGQAHPLLIQPNAKKHH